MEAWLDLEPRGFVVDEACARAHLPRLARRLLASDGKGAARAVEALLAERGGGEPPVFCRLLKPRGGQVHFLYFWKAFGEALRLTEGMDPGGGLERELETLRDGLLRQAEEAVAAATDAGSSTTTARLPIEALVAAVHRAAGMSARPHFWRDAAKSLGQPPAGALLGLEEVAGVLLAWLHRAAMEDQDGHASGLGSWFGGASRSVVESVQDTLGGGLVVCLNVYDVSQQENIQMLNSVLAHESSPLKFGGVFHAGVEVNGLEWSFGMSFSETKPGVACNKPRAHSQHHFRETVRIGSTTLSAEWVGAIISTLLEEYPGQDYDILRRNCCHFADDFCRRLGVGGIPGWVHRLARVGAQVDTLLHAAEMARAQLRGLRGVAAPFWSGAQALQPPHGIRRPPQGASGSRDASMRAVRVIGGSGYKHQEPSCSGGPSQSVCPRAHGFDLAQPYVGEADLGIWGRASDVGLHCERTRPRGER